MRVKSEILTMKKVMPTVKNRIFPDICFWINLEI